MPRISQDDVVSIRELLELLGKSYQGGHSEIGQKIRHAVGLLNTLEINRDRPNSLIHSSSEGQIEVCSEHDHLEVRGCMSNIVFEPVAANVVRVRIKKR